MAVLRLRCPNPSAHTLKLATSLHLFCSFGFEAALNMSRADKGTEKETFKQELKRQSRNAIVEPQHYLLKLPLRPADLLREHPDLYGKIYDDVYGYPVQPPISVAKVIAICNTFGCRNNGQDRSVNALVVAPTQPNSAALQQLQQPGLDMMALMGGMMNFMQNMVASQNRRDDIPIDFSAPKGRLASAACQQHSTVGLRTEVEPVPPRVPLRPLFSNGFGYI